MSQRGVIPAIRLYNVSGNDCAFQQGFLPEMQHLAATAFYVQSHIDDFEKTAHPAPRRQYVVTLKGKLLFRVTSGESFLIEPGVILLAEDLNGYGHSWSLVDGNEWIRLYIPIPENAPSEFVERATSA